MLVELGYRVHTPAELFGSREDSLGATDEEWLARVKGTGWVVLNRDAKIMVRRHELAAYRAAKLHMFYHPGEATSATLQDLLRSNLRDIVTLATSGTPNVWQVRARGVEPFK